jgi:hypothetical protein
MKYDPVIESEFAELADIGLVGGLCLVQRTVTTKGLNYLPLVGGLCVLQLTSTMVGLK